MDHKYRILLIAYYFPPLGGPASIRLGKTAKYLQQGGLEVDVVSVKNILYHSTDKALAEECSVGSIAYASYCSIPSILYYISKKKSSPSRTATEKEQQAESKGVYFSFSEKVRRFVKQLFPIDDKLLWYYPAKKAALKLMRTKKYDLIFVSIGPYTAGLVGYSLSKMTGIPLLVDFRDHWTLNPYEKFLTPLHRAIAEFWERKVVKQATYATCIGETMRLEMLSKYPADFPRKNEIVYNGHDEADFKGLKPIKEEPSKFVFTYTGNFYHQRTPFYFCKALTLLKQTGRLPGKVMVKFVGNYHLEARKIINSPELSGIVEHTPYLPHRKTLEMMLGSDCLLLFIPSEDGKGVLTSKLFEYMRSNRPVLAMMTDDCEAADILKSSKAAGYICPPEDIKSIAEAILDVISGKDAQKHNRRELSEDYSRQNQTMKILKMLGVKG